MRCPNCVVALLERRRTKQGVEVDHCGQCGGVWLDDGKLFNFAKQPEAVARALELAIPKSRPGTRLSPKTNRPMRQISLLGEKLVVDRCPETKGLWFDDGKLAELGRVVFKSAAGLAPWQGDSPELAHAGPSAGTEAGLRDLPDLRYCSILPFAAMYGILIAALAAAAKFTAVSAELAILALVTAAAAQFLGASFFLDKILVHLFPMNWISPAELPAHLREFVTRVCGQAGIDFPRFGMILDGAPNIFSYGSGPNKARIVVTRGLLNLLGGEELEAVVAHELGHAARWDLFFMTSAQWLPMALSYVYHSLMRPPDSGSVTEIVKEKAGSRTVKRAAVKSRIPGKSRYLLSFAVYAGRAFFEFFLLRFSRARECHADRFAGRVTKRPNALASALVKIAYGLAGVEKQGKPVFWCDACQATLTSDRVHDGLCKTCDRPVRQKERKRDERASVLESIGAFGVLDPKMALAFAAASYFKTPEGRHLDGGIPGENALAGWERWELDNPWARFYELFSTHPMLVKRLTFLGEQAVSMGQKPLVMADLSKLERFPQSFKRDLALVLAPPVLFGVLILLSPIVWKLWVSGLLGVWAFVAGTAMLAKLRFAYRNDLFSLAKISDLLQNTGVSGAGSEPCKIFGRLIGAGESKPFAPREFLLADDTGAICLDYRQPFRAGEFFFGLPRGKDSHGPEARVTGWYRRNPVPYIEVDTLKIGGGVFRGNARRVQTAVAWTLIAAGLLALAAS